MIPAVCQSSFLKKRLAETPPLPSSETMEGLGAANVLDLLFEVLLIPFDVPSRELIGTLHDNRSPRKVKFNQKEAHLLSSRKKE